MAETSITEHQSILSFLFTSLTLLILAALIQADSDRLLSIGRSAMQLTTTLLDVILINNIPSSPPPSPKSPPRPQPQPTKTKKSRKHSKKRQQKSQPVNIPQPRPQVHRPQPVSIAHSSVLSPPLSPPPASPFAPTSPPPAPEVDPAASRPPPSLSQSILKSILNPRASAYEYRARYYNLPSPPQSDIISQPLDVTPPHTDNTPSPPPKAIQPYDYFLVLDVEATCAQGAGFDYPNEIIEWPVVLMKWSDKDEEGRASELVIVDEFRSFVRPTWRTHLSEFCTSLTGITQADIDAAPSFTEVLGEFECFLQKHNLLPPPVALLTPPSSRSPSPAPTDAHDSIQTSSSVSSSPSTSYTSPSICSSPNTSPAFSPAWSTSSLPTNSPPNPYSFSALGIDGEGGPFPHSTRMSEVESADASWDSGYDYPRFAWATDGPFDLRDFLVKQCFISKIPIPDYFLQDNVIDVRKVVGSWVAQGGDAVPAFNPSSKDTTQAPPRRFTPTHQKRVSLNIPLQLQALSLGSFAGRQHSGIDDARNIGRIVQALAQRSVRLEANTYIQPNRRWYWMGEHGHVILPPSELLTSSA